MIPKIIHQYWDGDLPKIYSEFSEKHKQLNPNYEYNIWSKQSVLSICQSHTLHDHLKLSTQPVLSSDISRIILLDIFGGLYFDSDIRPEKPLPDHILHHDSFACYENEISLGQTIANGAIGSVPNSFFIKKIIEEIAKINPQKILQLNKNNCWLVTGPRLWTKIFFQTLTNQCLFVYPSWYFIPNHYAIKSKINNKGYLGTHIWRNDYKEIGHIIHYGHKKRVVIIQNYKELENLQND